MVLSTIIARRVTGTTGDPRIDKVVLVGQRGTPGCATVMAYGDGQLDVALYCEKPEEIRDSLKRTDRAGHDADYVQIPDVSGCGLRVIQLIEKLRSDLSL